ncbi:efflux RND transporter periplasmic adaptor subunit [Herbaspirillum sp. SJZ107]|uniref:efflux RND transporter periplasmic adaptor subunit n=1 Tax=Herbaspirillum sp. SJZ107 TaxID=2572881 RepID=UPI0011522601|nr:efflux RND transporter periplasmic adaptor subunit [Herbaspirillum sp. SJZ107]TQK10777.1 cobalt-zinc-cadmium efflux system membrane fusion protein [Herbaspirillum sp. SJZ107]
MTSKQKWTIALMCAVAAVLAALMLWRQPAVPAGAGHDAHQDSHGHDDRHPAEGGPPAAAGDNVVAMSDAQVKANGIAIDSARPALIGERLHLPARIAANGERTVALAAPAQGIVQSVAVSVGSAVRKGQALAVIRSPAVAQWRAELAAARQRQALARTTYEREKSLWEQRISARQDLDAADAALKEAGIAVQAARQRLDALAIGGGGGLSVGISSALTVRAPLDGVVVDKPAVAGQAVDDSKPLLTIADLSQVWVEAAVPAGSLGQVGTGMAAQVSIGARPQPIEGKVDLVGPVLGEASRMATARIVLANPRGALRPGMLASVDLLGPASTVAVTVASDAIQTVHERPVVFVRSAGGFRAQAVTLGRMDGKRTEIVSGLAAGTPYATAGSFLLKADLGKGEAEHED